MPGDSPTPIGWRKEFAHGSTFHEKFTGAPLYVRFLGKCYSKRTVPALSLWPIFFGKIAKWNSRDGLTAAAAADAPKGGPEAP
jgi:hypothetical protein